MCCTFFFRKHQNTFAFDVISWQELFWCWRRNILALGVNTMPADALAPKVAWVGVGGFSTVVATYSSGFVYWQTFAKPTWIWTSHYSHIRQWDVITHPCHNFNGGLTKPPLKLGHGWVITSQMNQLVWLLIYALISVEFIQYVSKH